MKTGLFVLVCAVLLVLAYAALDDITTGHEASFVLEWTVVGAVVLWLVFLAAVWLRGRAVRR